MKRISILLCSEEEAADTFTFLRGERSCKVLMRARVAAGYLFGLLNTTEAFLMVQHLHIQSRKAGGFGPAACSSCQQIASIAREIASQGTNPALKKMLKIVLLLIILLCN